MNKYAIAVHTEWDHTNTLKTIIANSSLEAVQKLCKLLSQEHEIKYVPFCNISEYEDYFASCDMYLSEPLKLGHLRKEKKMIDWKCEVCGEPCPDYME